MGAALLGVTDLNGLRHASGANEGRTEAVLIANHGHQVIVVAKPLERLFDQLQH